MGLVTPLATGRGQILAGLSGWPDYIRFRVLSGIPNPTVATRFGYNPFWYEIGQFSVVINNVVLETFFINHTDQLFEVLTTTSTTDLINLGVILIPPPPGPGGHIFTIRWQLASNVSCAIWAALQFPPSP